MLRQICSNCLRLVISARLKMSTFVSHVSPVTGKVEWSFRDENYDYNQEIARSAYADMLHDTERNQMYYAALKKAIEKKRGLNQAIKVLDIGTGTGLLSMMAARLGADTVTACEAFKPMADCAKKIMKQNGYGEKICLIPKRSTELEVGEGKDLPERCNILVTEVFDTELIGEGAIATFTHALTHLLEKDCIVVPSAANMYIQLVNSDLVRRWNQIDDILIPGADCITSPDKISHCGGAPSLHDLQLDQLPENTFTTLTKPFKVFRFDFSGRTALPFENKAEIITSLEHGGTIDGVFMWWDLEMDEDKDIILSCAPRWAHPSPDNMQWRDHWMQAIYYPYNCLTFNQEEKVKVISRYDEYSLWFDVARETSHRYNPVLERPTCTCGSHVTFSRTRMGMISDPVRRQIYSDALTQHTNKDSVCLSISDGSLLPLVAASLGVKHVFVLEPHPMCHRFLKDYVQHNLLEDRVTVLSKRPEELTTEDLNGLKITVVMGEPVFQSSVLPWDNMYFWYAVNSLTNHLTDNAVVLPRKMTIKGVCVDYENLWKIRADVGNCEGFDLSHFDTLIQKTSDKVDANIEPQPLWEYPCIAVSEVVSLLEVDFTSPVSDTAGVKQNILLAIHSDHGCNGLALWTEFDLGGDLTVSTGPRSDVTVGKAITWDYYTRQGVHLLQERIPSNNSLYPAKVNIGISFTSADGCITFQITPDVS